MKLSIICEEIKFPLLGWYLHGKNTHTAKTDSHVLPIIQVVMQISTLLSLLSACSVCSEGSPSSRRIKYLPNNNNSDKGVNSFGNTSHHHNSILWVLIITMDTAAAAWPSVHLRHPVWHHWGGESPKLHHNPWPKCMWVWSNQDECGEAWYLAVMCCTLFDAINKISACHMTVSFAVERSLTGFTGRLGKLTTSVDVVDLATVSTAVMWSSFQRRLLNGHRMFNVLLTSCLTTKHLLSQVSLSTVSQSILHSPKSGAKSR